MKCNWHLECSSNMLKKNFIFTLLLLYANIKIDGSWTKTNVYMEIFSKVRCFHRKFIFDNLNIKTAHYFIKPFSLKYHDEKLILYFNFQFNYWTYIWKLKRFWKVQFKHCESDKISVNFLFLFHFVASILYLQKRYNFRLCTVVAIIPQRRIVYSCSSTIYDDFTKL